MNDQQLDRSLRSIGKECFVRYFEEFSNPRYSSEDLIEMLMTKEGYAESGSRTRVSQSRRIINSGRAKAALKMVHDSERLADTVRERARTLSAGI